MTTPPASIDLTDLAFGDLARLGWRVVRFDPDLYGRLWRPTIYVAPLDFKEEDETSLTLPPYLPTSTTHDTKQQEQDTMRKKDVFPSKYLKLADVPQQVMATIKRMRLETVGVGEDAADKPTIEFMESTLKPLVLNAGNWELLENAYGDSDDWAGKKIIVFPDPTVMYKGQRVGGLRVRIPTTKKQPATPPAPPVPEELPDIENDYSEEVEAEA